MFVSFSCNFLFLLLLLEAMWNKAEDNTEALRSAFEAAAERAAEEAELATAEALARADREYRGATPASLPVLLFWFVCIV